MPNALYSKVGEFLKIVFRWLSFFFDRECMMPHQFMKLVLEAKLHRLDKFPHQCFFLIFTPKCVPLDIC